MDIKKECSNCKYSDTCAINHCDAVWDRAYNIRYGKDCWEPKDVNPNYIPPASVKNVESMLDDYISQVNKLKNRLQQAERERDAAIADITEFAKFYRRRTICDFCKHDSKEMCCDDCKKNYFINNCFEWRGYNK